MCLMNQSSVRATWVGTLHETCGQGSLHLDYLRGTFMYKHRYLQNTQAYCKHNFAGTTEKNWVF